MKISRLTAVCLAFLAIFFQACKTKTNDDILHPSGLRCEYLDQPKGIDVLKPRLMWISESKQKDQRQTAYQILVASSAEKLDKDNGDLWDSRKIRSDQSAHVIYEGKGLTSGLDCYWKVKVWDKDGKESQWSEPSSWTMGLTADADWKAKWIGWEKPSATDHINTERTVVSARYLRKEVDLSKKIRKATSYMCGLGISELYINGIKIGDEVLSPALTEYEKRSVYVTHDITKELKDGKNGIGVILGNGRFVAPRKKVPIESTNFGLPKLLLQIHIVFDDGTDTTIISDESWRITTGGSIVANNEYDGEIYDARKEMSGWDKPGFDDSKWMNVQIVTRPSLRIEAQMIEPIKVMQTIKPLSVKSLKPGVFIYDMGQNMVGWVRLKVKGKRGTEVKMRFAETLKKDGSLFVDNLRSAKVTDIYTLKGDGAETYEPRFTYHGFRFVEVTGYPGTPDLTTIEGKVIYDAINKTGTFECSSDIINKIYNNCVWGIKGNYRSIPTDCPQRDERQGWLGDRAVGSRGESFIFDISKLYSKWIGDMEDAQNEAGSIPDVAPTFWKIYNDNTTWAGTFIIVTDMLYQQYGDDAIIKKHYPAMKKWMTYMRKYMYNGLMTKDTYGDWCVPPESLHLINSKDKSRITPSDLIGTTYFYHEAQIMKHFAELQGLNNDVKNYQLLSDTLMTALNKDLLDSSLVIYGNNSATSSLLPLAYHMVPKQYEDKVFNNLVDKILGEAGGHVSNGLIGCQWMMRVLSDHGRPDIAYKLATNISYPSWGYMVENGATTIWELWNGNTADPGMNSGNHVMLIGDLVVWYYEYLAGIQTSITNPGFKEIIMNPVVPLDLRSVKASFKSIYGVIKSEWEIKEDKFNWNISIPANTKAIISIPAEDKNDIFESGKKASSAEGVEFIKTENGRVYFEVGSGDYSFVANHFKQNNKFKPYTMAPVITKDTAVALLSNFKVKISCPDKEAVIRYTLDGTVPKETSRIYKDPVEIEKTTTILAKSFKDGIEPSVCKSSTIVVYDPKVNGLNYDYYEGEWTQLPDFNKLNPKCSGTTINFNVSKLKKRADYFGIVFKGFINLPVDGEYNFYLASDDGSKLIIDNQVVVVNDFVHGISEREGTISLKAGKYPVVIEFFDALFDEILVVYIKEPGMPKHEIPVSMLFKK